MSLLLIRGLPWTDPVSLHFGADQELKLVARSRRLDGPNVPVLFNVNPSAPMYNSNDLDLKRWIIAMVDLDPHAIREVMSDARQKSKDPAEGFMLGISIVLAAGVIIRVISGEEPTVRSIWTYLEGIAVVYAFAF